MFDSEGVRDLLLPKPSPKHVLLSTSALLHHFDQTVYAGGHAFVDTADVFRRLVRAEKGVPPKLCIYTPFLDQLHSHYIVLLDAALRANEACARYLFSCRRALDPPVMHSNLRTQVELDTLQAFTEFWVRCMEVRTSVDDTFAQWEEAAEQLRIRTAQISPAVQWLFCFTSLAYSVFKRRAILADLPSVHDKAQRDLHRVGGGYTKLATTLAKIEAARTTGVPEADSDAAGERCRNLRIAIYALVRLDSALVSFRFELVKASRQQHHWPSNRLSATPLRSLLKVEADFVANAEAYWIHWV